MDKLYSEAEHDPTSSLTAVRNDGKKHLLLAVSDSTAALRLWAIMISLRHLHNLSICIVLDKSTVPFFGRQHSEKSYTNNLTKLIKLPHVDVIHFDKWQFANQGRQCQVCEIPHKELCGWAHILAVLPVSASLSVNVAGDLCDDSVRRVISAWDKRKPLQLAMTRSHREHSDTAERLAMLGEGLSSLEPGVKQSDSGKPDVRSLPDWWDMVGGIKEDLARIVVTSSTEGMMLS